MKLWSLAATVSLMLIVTPYVIAQQVEQTPMQQALDRFTMCQVQNVNHSNQQVQEFYAKIQEKQVLLDTAQKEIAELKRKVEELQSNTTEGKK